ncbi:MAG: hypothetical protein KAR16_14690, partial [Bacteroidales bacterium]|nr:hypothetical protein [Bacteroidales bacterium]
MAGLRISTFFWYLDSQVADDVLTILKEGKFDVDHSHLKKREELRDKLVNDPPDMVISDFDLPLHQRQVIEVEMEPYLAEVPLIYLVGEKNVRKAAETLKTGVWDFVQ